MKKLQILVVLLSVSLSVFATDKKDGNISSLATCYGSTLMLNDLFLEDAPTTISITDASGYVLYKVKRNQLNKLPKRFQFTEELEGQNLTLKVENEFKKVNINLMVKNGQVAQLSQDKKIFKPQFRTVGDKLFMNHLNMTNEEVVVKVIDNQGSILAEQHNQDSKITQLVFDFSKNTDIENLAVLVEVGNETFYYDMAK